MRPTRRAAVLVYQKRRKTALVCPDGYLTPKIVSLTAGQSAAVDNIPRGMAMRSRCRTPIDRPIDAGVFIPQKKRRPEKWILSVVDRGGWRAA